MADEHVLPRADPGRRPRRRDPARHRAEPALEDVLAPRARARAGPRRRARRHVRLAARRRAAHAAGAGDARPRPTGSSSKSSASSRRATKGRPGIVGILLDACREAGIAVGEPLGRRAALRLARAEPARRARARAPVRRADRIDVDLAELEAGGRGVQRAGERGRRADADTAAYVEELERRVDLMEAERGSAVGRDARRRADALPPRARRRGRQRRKRRRSGLLIVYELFRTLYRSSAPRIWSRALSVLLALRAIGGSDADWRYSVAQMWPASPGRRSPPGERRSVSERRACQLARRRSPLRRSPAAAPSGAPPLRLPDGSAAVALGSRSRGRGRRSAPCPASCAAAAGAGSRLPSARAGSRRAERDLRTAPSFSRASSISFVARGV